MTASGASSDGPEAFRGTARDYARCRVPYPRALLDDLLARAGVTGGGRLLDLACGPGRVALAVAPRFAEVWAVDREPEMLEAGREEAARQEIANVRWRLGRAEDFEAVPGSFELITVGEAMHRLDQPLIARKALDWLGPGGCLATLGCFGLLKGEEPWHQVLREVVGGWAACTARPSRRRGGDYDAPLLRAAGFVEVESHDFQQPVEWTLDSIIGNLASTSMCSRHKLGHRAGLLEAELRAALQGHDARGVYAEQVRFGYTIGRRPKR